MLNKEDRIKNLKRANEEIHKLTDKALKEALYKMLKKKNINEIKITDLIKLAGISRATYYKHYYSLADILKDDLDEIINSVLSNLTSSLYTNWLLVFCRVYECKDKLALIYKAGLSIDFLNKLNKYFKDSKYGTRYIVWNGIVFNAIYIWGLTGFKKTPKKLAEEITELTKPFLV